MPDQTVTSHDGTPIAFRDYGGTGPDVVLLHGASRNLEDWRAVLEHLDGFRVVAIDQRFHGHSGVGTTVDPSDWVHDVEAVIEAAGLSNPFVAGHSMGGVNAILYGIEHPACPGVLNIDGYDVRRAEFYDEFSPEQVEEFLGNFAARSSSFLSQGDEGDDAWHEQQVAMFNQMSAAWGVDSEITRAVVARAFVRNDTGRWERRPPNAFWSLVMGDGEAVDILGLLRRSSCPVTVLVCTQPMPMPAPAEVTKFIEAGKRGLERHLRNLAQEQPSLRVETIDATHGVIYERPADIARHIGALASP